MLRKLGLVVLFLTTALSVASEIDASDVGIRRDTEKTTAFTSSGALPTIDSTRTTQTTTKLTNKPDTVSKTTKKATSTPTNDVAILSLSTSLINTRLATLDIDGQVIPISCINCSLSGNLHVSGTQLTWNEDLATKGDGTGFEGGIFNATLPHGLKGHLELGLNPLRSLSHTFSLLTIPISGFVVPGLATAGVSLELSIPISIQLEKPAKVSFGFEFQIPENSSISIDVADPKNSTAKVLGKNPGQDFNLLPLNISEPGLNVKLTTGLAFGIKIGADMLDNDVRADVGAHLLMPEIAIEELQVSNVDEKCNRLEHNGTAPLHTATRATTTTPISTGVGRRAESEQSLRNYTNIVPSIGFEMGVYVAAGLQNSVKGVNLNIAEHTEVPVFSMTLSQTTTCINNHAATAKSTNDSGSTPRTTTTVPGQTVATGSGTTAASPSKASSGASTQRGSGDGIVRMGGSNGFALAIAVGWLVALL